MIQATRILSLVLISPWVAAQWCEPLYEDSITALQEAIELSASFAYLCPFTIRGEGCKSNHHYGYDVRWQEAYVMCDTFYSNEGCIVDCPGRHFTVLDGASLILDGITLQGATNTSVYVMSGGALVTYSSNFDRNCNDDDDGGAIKAEMGTNISIIYSDFSFNRAPNGGAISYHGRAEIESTTFLHNAATMGNGGAIQADGHGAAGVLAHSFFSGNEARLFGPALFNYAPGTLNAAANIACVNLSSNNLECNGSFEFSTQKCKSFKRRAACKTDALGNQNGRSLLRKAIKPY